MRAPAQPNTMTLAYEKPRNRPVKKVEPVVEPTPPPVPVQRPPANPDNAARAMHDLDEEFFFEMMDHPEAMERLMMGRRPEGNDAAADEARFRMRHMAMMGLHPRGDRARLRAMHERMIERQRVAAAPQEPA